MLLAGCADSTARFTAPEAIPSSLTLNADSLTLEQGDAYLLDAVVRDQWGEQMPAPARVEFSTTDPLVATVGAYGLVAASAHGRAIIRASTTAGNATLADSIIVVVPAPQVLDHVVLTALTGAWSPRFAHVASGGEVKWAGGFTGMPANPVSTVYLWKTDSAAGSAEQFDVSTAPVTRTLTQPGSYTYCSNYCWDPWEYGVIFVHSDGLGTAGDT